MKKLIIVFSALLIYSLTYNINNCSAQWVPLGGSLGGDIEDLVVFNSNLYAGGTASIFRSTNNGDNWSSHMPIPAYAWSIASSGSNIYCGVWSGGMTLNSGVYRSTNNGLNWSLVGLNNNNISDLAADDQQIIAIAFVDNKVYRSTNSGNNWVDITGPLTLGVYKVAVSGNRIYAGAQGLHVTTNNGVSWSAVFMSDNIESISVSDSLIFAGTYSNGIYRSSDYGQNWERTLVLNKRIKCIYQYGTYVFAGADTGFYVSTNSGMSFIEKSQGLGNASISSIVIHNNYVFVSNSNYLSTNVSAWKRPLQEVIGIQNISTEIPSSFSLSQNYPNPFNPTTNIRFDIPKTSYVKLTIHDILGKEVAVLVNEQLHAGSYKVDWDGSSYASGVYYYKLMTDNFSETKKMLLIK